MQTRSALIGGPQVERVLSRPGRALDSATRGYMEPRFGTDFGSVRVHADPQAAAAAGAQAFTVGDHIVFGSEPPRSDHRLLAHELAHVVQQRGSGLRIQRQVDPTAERRRAYIDLACERIAEIRRGVEEGRTWFFEDELGLQGDERIPPPGDSLIRARRDALHILIEGLDESIQMLADGRLNPLNPPDVDALADLWQIHRPSSERGLAERWVNIQGSRRQPDGTLARIYPSLGSYIVISPGSPPGMLRPAPLPTWWVLGCQRGSPPSETPRQEPMPPRDSVIYLGGDGRWDWEPRRPSYPPALGRIYEWHFDRNRRIYIVVDGRRMVLRPDRQLEPAE